MLRLLALLLLLSNAGYFVWSHGALAAYGFAPATQSEPQRLAQQLRPEALRIVMPPEAAPPGTRQLDPTAALPAAAPTSSAAPPSAPDAPAPSASQAQAAVATQCLQAGLFSEAQSAALQARLQSALPRGGWAFESSVEPARWMIYMGRYASPEALAKKKGELRQRKVSFEPLSDPALEHGLSLGSFSTQLDADTELARIARRGVKTARVIQVRPELRGQKLTLPAVTPAMRTQLDTLKPQLAGKALQACR